TIAIRTVILSVLVSSNSVAEDKTDLRQLSLEQLMDVPVVTATRTTEKLAYVPATTIVLTQSDFKERGYRQLADLLDDLPGMDVVRGWGDHWYANYVRG